MKFKELLSDQAEVAFAKLSSVSDPIPFVLDMITIMDARQVAADKFNKAKQAILNEYHVMEGGKPKTEAVYEMIKGVKTKVSENLIYKPGGKEKSQEAFEELLDSDCEIEFSKKFKLKTLLEKGLNIQHIRAIKYIVSDYPELNVPSEKEIEKPEVSAKSTARKISKKVAKKKVSKKSKR